MIKKHEDLTVHELMLRRSASALGFGTNEDIFVHRIIVVAGKGYTAMNWLGGVNETEVPSETGTYKQTGLEKACAKSWTLSEDQPLGYVWDEKAGAMEVWDIHDVPALGDKFIRNPRRV